MSAQTEYANQQSGVVRFDRATSKAHVQRGGSLTLLLRDGRRHELEGMLISKLVQWMPSVGISKASRVCVGLPYLARLRDLDATQRQIFVSRVANLERSLILYRLERS